MIKSLSVLAAIFLSLSSYAETPLECYKKLEKENPRVTSQILVTVCKKSTTSYPLKCYRDLTSHPFFANSDLAIAAEVCAQAKSDAPFNCFKDFVTEFPNTTWYLGAKLCSERD